MDDRSAWHVASSVGGPTNRLAVILATAVLAVVQAGCGGGGTDAPVTPVCTVTGVTVAASPATIASGGSSTLSATLDASAACATGLTWSVTPAAGGTLTPSVSDPTTATFTSTTSTTSTTYTVRAASVADPTKFGTATITVTDVPPVCTVASVTVSPATATVDTGATSSHSAAVSFTGPCAGTVTWSAPVGGTVTPSGLDAGFAALTPGLYTLIATSTDDTTKQGQATITVSAPPPVCTVASVTVSPATATVGTGATSSHSAAVSFTGPCAGTVTWSAPVGGTVTPSGLNAGFAALTPGLYTLIATSTDDTTKQGQATITVSAPPPVCTVASVTVSPATATVGTGATSSHSAAVSFTGPCAGTVTWSAPVGGTVTPSGLNAGFAASTPGIYTLAARSTDDITKQGQATITVNAPPPCIVTGVAVSASPTTFEAGLSSTLSASVTATAQCTRALTWSVSSDNGGTLTPSTPSGATANFASSPSSTPGVYRITATSVENPGVSGFADVTVTPALPCTVSGLTLAAGPASISSGGTSILTASLTTSAACTRALDWSVSGGGTLTPSGVTTSTKASFTAIAQTPYTVTVTSVDDNTRQAQATVTVGPAVACGAANGATITHPGGTVITADETWVGDGVTHHLPGSVEIRGAKVTIQPCAVVTLGAIGSILVQESGTLLSAGTGGNRFVEIGSVNPGLTSWGLISASTPTSLVDLRFTNVREGGETVGLPMMLRGVGAGDGSPLARVLRVQSVEISGGNDFGVSLELNAAFTDDSTDLIVKGHKGYPLRANLAALGTLPSGDYTQNARDFGADEIVVHGPGATLSTDMTIKNLGVPYRFEVPFVQVQPVAPSPGPVTLTIQPGVTLKFPRRVTGIGQTAPGALFSVGTAGLTPNGAGVLNAVGTPLAPIVFTSGQDLPLAAPPVSPAAGDWQGLWLATAAGSRLENVEIRYAGAPVTLSSGNCRPLGSSDAAALLVGNLTDQYVPAADLLVNGTIADSAGHGINALWDSATPASGPDLTPTNTFLNLNGCRQTFNGVTTGTCPGNGCLVQ